MLFDDRLTTVLRTRASGEAASRTQFRQLLDLLGGDSVKPSTPLVGQGFERLDLLSQDISEQDRASILEEPWLKISNPYLIEWLSKNGGKPASAVLSRAILSDAQWQEIIPRLDVTSRGLLRHRRDLPQGALDTLARLGVGDLVLPMPESTIPEASTPAVTEDKITDTPAKAIPVKDRETPTIVGAGIAGAVTAARIAAKSLAKKSKLTKPDPAKNGSNSVSSKSESEQAIGALRKRIEDYQLTKKRSSVGRAMGDPRLPLGDEPEGASLLPAFEFASDASGRITWAEPRIAPMLVGAKIADPSRWSIFRPAPSLVAAMSQRRPFHAAGLTIVGAETGPSSKTNETQSDPNLVRDGDEIAGQWLVDAAPIFLPDSGVFDGYAGRMRRDATMRDAANDTASNSGEQMRQLLHELRTPMNAIQGFAEAIQQQIFGHVPNTYRALAAAIALDAANLLGGFDEIDRLAKLESGAMELEDGEADWREAIAITVQRLNSVLAPREAGFELSVSGSPFTIGMDQGDTLTLAWRILACLAGQMAPGETLPISLIGEGAKNGKSGQATLSITLPATFGGSDDAFHTQRANQASSISSGMFGTGFTLRLARQETRAAGGELEQVDGKIMVNLPVLTDKRSAHSDDGELKSGTGAT